MHGCSAWEHAGKLWFSSMWLFRKYWQVFPTKSAKMSFSTFHIIKTVIHINWIFMLKMAIRVGNILSSFDFHPCGCLGNIGERFPVSPLKCHIFNQMCIFQLPYLQNGYPHQLPIQPIDRYKGWEHCVKFWFSSMWLFRKYWRVFPRKSPKMSSFQPNVHFQTAISSKPLSTSTEFPSHAWLLCLGTCWQILIFIHVAI